jgi:hypothetical protein
MDKSKSNVSEITDEIVRGFKKLEGKVVGSDMQKSSMRLSKDNKGAFVNNLVDQYIKKELSNEYLEQIKEEQKITSQDIMREIAKREIQKALGQ